MIPFEWLVNRGSQDMSEIRNKAIFDRIKHLILTRQSFPNLAGDVNVQVRVARGTATVAVGSHHRGPVVAVSVCPDWLENVGGLGIGSVGFGLTLAATPAAANICPEGAERTWLVQWAQVKKVTASAGTAGAGPTFLAVARLGYICEYGGLFAFGVDPNLALKVCVDTYYNAIQGKPGLGKESELNGWRPPIAGSTIALTAKTSTLAGQPHWINQGVPVGATGGARASSKDVVESIATSPGQAGTAGVTFDNLTEAFEEMKRKRREGLP